MEIKIYADVLFCINAFMDFFILWLTSVLSGKKIRLWKLIIGGILLSFFCCLGLFSPMLSFLYSPIGAFLLLCLGVIILFRPHKMKELFYLLTLAYGGAFFVGGISIAIFFFMDFSSVFGQNIFFSIRHFSWKILLCSTGIFYIMLKVGKIWVEAHITKGKEYCTMVITCNGRKAELCTLIDTGNGLIDPFSGNYVVIAAFPAVESFFSEESKLLFYQHVLKEAELQEYMMVQEKELSLRLIPFSSLGTENGLLLVFRPEGVRLLWGDKSIERKDIMVGIYSGVFQGGYHGLVNPELLNSCQAKS